MEPNQPHVALNIDLAAGKVVQVIDLDAIDLGYTGKVDPDAALMSSRGGRGPFPALSPLFLDNLPDKDERERMIQRNRPAHVVPDAGAAARATRCG